jgi:hypothetical protein
MRRGGHFVEIMDDPVRLGRSRARRVTRGDYWSRSKLTNVLNDPDTFIVYKPRVGTCRRPKNSSRRRRQKYTIIRRNVYRERRIRNDIGINRKRRNRHWKSFFLFAIQNFKKKRLAKSLKLICLLDPFKEKILLNETRYRQNVEL